MLWKLRLELVFLFLAVIAGIMLTRLPEAGQAVPGAAMVDYRHAIARETARENQRRRALDSFQAAEPLTVAGFGKVTALDPIGRPTWLTVQAVDPGLPGKTMIALDPRGNLVGRVVETRGGQLKIMTILNPESRVSIILQESRCLGVLESSGPLLALHARYIGNDAPAAENETAVTSAIGSHFPPGIPVGRVKQARPGPALFQEVTIREQVNFSRLEEVVLVY